MRLREQDFAAFGSVEQDGLAPTLTRNSVAWPTQATRSEGFEPLPPGGTAMPAVR